jgi:predicted DNA-binding protein
MFGVNKKLKLSVCISIRVTPEVAEKVAKIASKTGQGPADVFRDLINHGLGIKAQNIYTLLDEKQNKKKI